MTKITEETAQVQPARKRRVVWHGLRVVWLLASLPVLFALIAAAMMIDQEITAPSWITARVEERAAQMLGGGQIDFGEITLHVGTDLHPRVSLTDTVLRDAAGAPLARVAHVSGLLSPRGLILDRSALLQEVVLSGVQIALRRNADGSVAISFDRGAVDAGAAESLAELLEQIDEAFAQPALEALEQIRVDGVVVNYADARAGRNWTVDGGQFGLDLRGNQFDFVAEVAVLSGGSLGTLSFAYASPRDSHAATLVLDVAGLPARDIATQSPALAWLGSVDAPLSARLESALDATGHLGVLDAALTIGAGEIRPQGSTQAFAFDGATADLAYDPADQRLDFNKISLQSEWGEINGQGQAFAAEVSDGLPQSLVGQFQFEALTLNPAALFPAPVALGDLSVDFRLGLSPFAIDLGQAVLVHDSGTLVARGTADAGSEGWSLAVDVQGDRLPRDRVLALWPSSFRPRSRDWFETNMIAAQITDFNLGFRSQPDADRRMAVSYAFEDAVVRVMRHMPLLTDARGQASLIDNRFVLRMAAGQAIAPQGGIVDLSGSVMTIPDVRIKPAQMELDLTTDSSVTAALSILNQPPFTFLDKANLPVTLADGRAETIARLRFPIRKPVPKSEFIYDVTSALRRVSSDVLIPDRRLTSSGLMVEANNSQLSLTGPIRLDEVPLRGSWTQVMGVKGSQVDVAITLSPTTLGQLGITLPRGAVSGEGLGELVIDLRRGEAPAFRLTSTLEGVGLNLPQIGWSKAAAQAADFRVRGNLGARPTIDSLQLSGGGLDVDGRIELNADGSLAAARFSRVRVGSWLDAPVTLRGRGRGRPVAVEIAGGVLDLRLARFGSSGGNAGGPVAISLDRLQVSQGIALRGFRGEFNSAGGLSGQFTARVNDGPGVRGTVAPQNGRTAVRIQSDDAGGVVRAAGLLKNGIGGDLDLRLIPAGGTGSFDGYLTIAGIRVRDAPAIAALLDAISVVGLLQQLDGQGLAFDEVDARFRLTPEQVIVTEASAIGPGLGISLDGVYMLASKSFDFQGVVSPFYLLNGIGAVLTRRGEGLIGFNFNLRGTAEAPDVAVNPLSALTPGMFREIFRRPAPQVNQ